MNFNSKQLKRLLQNKYFRITSFALVFLFTFVLRAHNYDRTPGMGHLEEEMYAWSGQYLIETGTPVAWSTLDYPKKAEVYKGKIDFKGNKPAVFVTMYKPWLDEPPLFSLITGFFAHINGADRNMITPSSYIRIPLVLMATITALFVFLIVRLVSGFWSGILAMFLYGTIPILVFGSRLAVAENLIAMLYMIVIFLMVNFVKKPKFWYLLPIPILVGIAGLAKPTGYLLLPLVIYFALSKRYFKSCLYLILATIPFVLAYFLYGTHFDSQIFWRLYGIQSTRPVGFSSLAWFFVSPAYDITTFTDSWYIFGLISGAFFLFSPKKDLQRLISLAFLYWVGVVMISGGEGDLLPWYRYPVFPLIAIMAAWGVTYLVERADIFTSFLGIGMLMGNRYLLVNAFRSNIAPQLYRLTFGGLMLPAILNSLSPQKWLLKASRVVLIVAISLGLWYNIQFIYNKFELDCESQSCPIGPSTGLSTLHIPILARFMVLGETTYK